MTSFSKSANACSVQSEGRNIDEVSIAVPNYVSPDADGRAYLGAAIERTRTLRPFPFHSSNAAPAVI